MGEMKKASTSAKPAVGEFRPGPAGSCEAHLYEFHNEHSNLDAGLVAGSSLLQAVEYMARHESEFHIQSVRRIGIIVLLSGSQYN
jgi:hypothetical protein